MGWMAPWRHRRAKMVVVKDHQQREPSMGDITTIGLDLAKNVFQVHAVDVAGSVVLRKQLRRGQVLAFFAELPPCLIGLEACATAHHWARELIALGHETRLMPPSYVKAYVKRNKHDVADAEAICEAVRRPSMRFVPLKTAEQQSALMMHRARDLLIRQRTMLARNALPRADCRVGLQHQPVLGLGSVCRGGCWFYRPLDHSNRAASLRFQRCLQVLDHGLKLLVRQALDHIAVLDLVLAGDQ